MKPNISNLLLILFALLLGTPAMAQTDKDNQVEADSKIDAVTVFLQSAQVNRTSDVLLKKGRNEVLFRGLANGIDPRSIQVSAPSEVLINTVVLESNFLDPNKDKPRIKTLTDSLTILGRLVADEQDKKAVLAEERKLLQSNQALASEEEGLDIEELKRAAAFFRQRMTDLADRIRKSDRTVAKYNVRKGQINKQLKELNYRKNRKSNDIRVVFSTYSTRKVPVELKYVVSNAGWGPRYDLRAQNTSSPVQLDYRADVYQNTGVDWEQVDLTLSTGNPNLGGSQPEMSQWNLYVYSPPPPAPKKARAKMESRAYDMDKSSDDDAEYDEMEEEPEEEGLSYSFNTATTLADYTQVTEGATTAQFAIGIRQDIPSGGKAQQVSVASHELPADYRHFAVPRSCSDAYLLAEVTEWEKLNLLAGPVQIFFEGTYVAESRIDPTVTSDTLRFSMGRDPRVIVQREQLKDYRESRILGTNKERTFAYKTTIRNTKPEKVVLRLEDQVPISQDKNIVVKVEEISGASRNEDTGMLEWDMELGPSESKEVTLVFSVRYPKNKVVTGL